MNEVSSEPHLGWGLVAKGTKLASEESAGTFSLTPMTSDRGEDLEVDSITDVHDLISPACVVKPS